MLVLATVIEPCNPRLLAQASSPHHSVVRYITPFKTDGDVVPFPITGTWGRSEMSWAYERVMVGAWYGIICVYDSWYYRGGLCLRWSRGFVFVFSFFGIVGNVGLHLFRYTASDAVLGLRQ